MNPLAKLPGLPYLLGFSAIAVLLVVFRGVLGLSLLFVLLILLVLLLVGAIVFLLMQLRKAQQAEEIEKTISNQADLDIERSTPGQLAEMQRLLSLPPGQRQLDYSCSGNMCQELAAIMQSLLDAPGQNARGK